MDWLGLGYLWGTAGGKSKIETPRALGQNALSQSRVALDENAVREVFCTERCPLLAPLLHGTQVTVALANLVEPLNKLHPQACSDMERDVAVHEPSARVVGLEGEHEIAASGQRGRVASDGVGRLQARNVACPWCVFLLVQHPEVVAVQVDGVG
jgi:hypothetical protein